MSGREFREGLDMMAGKTSFTINSGKATGIEPPSGNRRFMGCTIESIPLAPLVESREKSRLFLYFQRFSPFGMITLITVITLFFEKCCQNVATTRRCATTCVLPRL